MLRADGVSASAGRSPLTFEVAAGRCVGLQGRSAADTSQLLLVAAGLTPPASGTVLIDGGNPVRDAVAARRRVSINRLQCVDSRLRLGEYLHTVAAARRAMGTETRRSVAATMERLGLNGARVLSSASARAEAALAAALLPAVGLVILDEPFAALSADSRDRAIEWIRSLSAEPVAVLIGGSEERDLRAVSHQLISTEPAR